MSSFKAKGLSHCSAPLELPITRHLYSGCADFPKIFELPEKFMSQEGDDVKPSSVLRNPTYVRCHHTKCSRPDGQDVGIYIPLV